MGALESAHLPVRKCNYEEPKPTSDPNRLRETEVVGSDHTHHKERTGSSYAPAEFSPLGEVT